MADYPALPLWTDALIGDTSHLDDERFGLYMRVLILMWRTPGCRVPNDLEWVMDKLPGRTKEQLTAIFAEFCSNDGNWIWQKRLKQEYRYVRATRTSRSAAAKSRWQKKKDSYRAYAPTPTPTPTIKNPPVGPPKGGAHGVNGHDVLEAQDDQAVEMWNEFAKAHGLTAVEITAARRRALRLTLSEIGIDGWAAMFKIIAKSPLLLGIVGKRGWKVTFDWVLKPANMQKLAEGNYVEEKVAQLHSGGHRRH